MVLPIPETESETSEDKPDDEPELNLLEHSLKKNSVASYRALYLSGELTPLDVVNAILPLIRRDLSPPGKYSVGWFDVKADQILDAAKASTERYKTHASLGPLDGIPTGVKDEYDVEGYVTSLGSVNDYTGQPPDDDSITSWCVMKLEEAGAVIMGKLSMHEFGLGDLTLKLYLQNIPLI